METRVYKHLDNLIDRHPELICVKDNIYNAYILMRDAYLSKLKVIVAGNGGSAADSEHIVGELMKRFKIPRKLDDDLIKRLCDVDPEIGEVLSKQLEKPMRAVALTSHMALTTAYINDVDGQGIFAQQILGLGDAGDVFIAISTSGNSKNIINAAVVAKAKDIKIVGLTGRTGGKLVNYADVLINVPEDETYKIQELHLPIYHCLCMMLEECFFGSE